MSNLISFEAKFILFSHHHTWFPVADLPKDLLEGIQPILVKKLKIDRLSVLLQECKQVSPPEVYQGQGASPSSFGKNQPSL